MTGNSVGHACVLIVRVLNLLTPPLHHGSATCKFPRTSTRVFGAWPMRILLLASAYLILPACQSTVSTVRGPGGESYHHVECRFMQFCSRRATQLCPTGYFIADSVRVSHPQSLTFTCTGCCYGVTHYTPAGSVISGM